MSLVIWEQTKQNESTRLPSSDSFRNCSLHSPRHITNCHSLWFSVSLSCPPLPVCPLTPFLTCARYTFLVLTTIACSHNAMIVRITHRECKKLPHWWFQSSRGDVELGSFSSLCVSCHGILISCSCSLKLACRCCYSLFYVLFFFPLGLPARHKITDSAFDFNGPDDDVISINFRFIIGVMTLLWNRIWGW